MPTNHSTITITVADIEPVKAIIATAIELGNAVCRYFDVVGDGELTPSEQAMREALDKWQGLYE